MTAVRSVSDTDDCFDAGAWLQRWELQQARHVPEREDTFELMLDVLARLDAEPGRLLDLGCGPGSLAARVLARWPAADVVGIDLDPLLLELGKQTLGTRVRWLEADLRDPSWIDPVEGPLDAAVSATALHWLDPGHLVDLAEGLAARLRSGGVFANYDTMQFDHTTPRLRTLSDDLRRTLNERALAEPGAEAWSDWWDSVGQEPAFRHLLTERTRRFGERMHGTGTTLSHFVNALCSAGFQEVATLKQVANRRLLIAIR